MYIQDNQTVILFQTAPTFRKYHRWSRPYNI